VPTLEERVAYLEGKVEEHSRGYAQIREDVQQLRATVQHLDQHLSARIDALDQRLSARIDALDQKVDRFREELAGRIDALDQKFSRWFAWLTGILITALLAQLGLLAGALFRR
jgi:outer membrane murein-binding lipoprotein Lpp